MMLYFFPLPLLVCAGVLAIPCVFFAWKRPDKRNLIFLTIFGLYLLAYVRLVFFPMPYQVSPGPVLTHTNAAFTLSHVNLRLFHYGIGVSDQEKLSHSLYNILLTLPFGFLVNFFQPVKMPRLAWLAPAFGCAGELGQLAVSLLVVGGPYRSVDITDAFFNTVGVLLGWRIFKLIRILFRGIG